LEDQSGLKKHLRIIFFGTPEFAVASLKALVEGGKNVVAVVTAPDRPAGRGQKIRYSDIKTFALEKQLPVLQPNNLKSESFLAALKAFEPDLQIVVAFRMLPEAVWNMPPMGTFNLHASLLPQYRGAAPINWAVINGEKETGVTTFFLKHAIDTGDIILQEKAPIFENDDAGTVHDRLMELGARLTLKTVNLLEQGDVHTSPQSIANPKAIKAAPKLFKDDCRIDWGEDVAQIHNKIRGLSPYPAAFTTIEIDGKKTRLKVYRSSFTVGESHTPPIAMIENGKLCIHGNGGRLFILEVQAEGKRRMNSEDFIRGIHNNIALS
jgi:methionyl-tRNA formyltransferase